MAGTGNQQVPTALNAHANVKRVVWIIFDELDERVGFKERPASLSLPEFDRLRQISLVASAARPPAGATIQSIPALLNGRMISLIAPRGDSLLLWNLNEEQPVIWNQQMTLFADTSAAGMKTGLAGVYLPYCNLLAGSINDCRDFRTFRARESLKRRIARTIVVALDAVPLAYRFSLRGVNLRYEIEQYESAIHEASSLAADPTFQLVYIHLPVPHPPARYDRNSGHLDPSPTHSYLDSLKLADVSLGALRQAMEQSGVWAESTVIVSSDHWWRTNLWRNSMYWIFEDEQTFGGRAPEHLVPFMVKLSGASDALSYGRPFNTVITRKMISAIQKGTITRHAELASWLDANAVGPVEPILTPDVIASAPH